MRKYPVSASGLTKRFTRGLTGSRSVRAMDAIGPSIQVEYGYAFE
jgi:hypothetical protein